jgi:amidophosphoribosyltransferase
MNIKYVVALCILIVFDGSKAGENIGHECGFALVRLRKSLYYYQEKYTDISWGGKKLCALIEEQRHRGQDGAGVAVMKFNMPAGKSYIKRFRNADAHAIDIVLNTLLTKFSLIPDSWSQSICETELKTSHEFLGEVYLGHVRYGTHSTNDVHCCQPYICKNSIASESFMLAGNFNMTNSQELCDQLVCYGLTPTATADTYLVMELINYYLRQEHARAKSEVDLIKNKTEIISKKIDIVRVIHDAFAHMDGGYVFAGCLGNGDIFVCRDPAGIRPGFFYIDDEVFAAASERAALMNVFGVNADHIQEVEPGHVLIIKQDGSLTQHQFIPLLPIRQCSFERIYFSKVNDPVIYEGRKRLGKNLAERVFEILGPDIINAVFTYIPNSSESAFIGFVEELQRVCGNTPVRVEKLVHKNQHLRTFITNDRDRCNLVARLYSTTKGIITPHDTLVVIDDSIVRGTTLRKSIIKELINLQPKQIIFVSSAPLVLYPDCYGIDMSQIGSFIAFQAMVELLKEEGKSYLFEEIANKCEAQKYFPVNEMINYVQELYKNCSKEALEHRIATMIRPKDLPWSGNIQIVYQSIKGLHAALPDYSGDWCFTGNYPTPGGYKVLNTSYLRWYKGCDMRAY